MGFPFDERVDERVDERAGKRNGSTTNGAEPGHLNGARPFFGRAPTAPGPAVKIRNRGQQQNTPVPVEATVYWWQTGVPNGSCLDNQFGTLPATAVRFRCIGTLTPKYPKRYRVELAQALDTMPHLTRSELRQLGASLAAAIGKELGVEVAPFNGDVIDLCPSSACG